MRIRVRNQTPPPEQPQEEPVGSRTRIGETIENTLRDISLFVARFLKTFFILLAGRTFWHTLLDQEKQKHFLARSHTYLFVCSLLVGWIIGGPKFASPDLVLEKAILDDIDSVLKEGLSSKGLTITSLFCFATGLLASHFGALFARTNKETALNINLYFVGSFYLLVFFMLLGVGSGFTVIGDGFWRLLSVISLALLGLLFVKFSVSSFLVGYGATSSKLIHSIQRFSLILLAVVFMYKFFDLTEPLVEYQKERALAAKGLPSISFEPQSEGTIDGETMTLEGVFTITGDRQSLLMKESGMFVRLDMPCSPGSDSIVLGKVRAIEASNDMTWRVVQDTFERIKVKVYFNYREYALCDSLGKYYLDEGIALSGVDWRAMYTEGATSIAGKPNSAHVFFVRSTWPGFNLDEGPKSPIDSPSQ